jgi:hypothetical protein
MNRLNSFGICLILLLAGAPGAIAQSPNPMAPTLPQTPIREPVLLACPQTVASDAAQELLAKGETAKTELSYYPQGFISPNAICITRADKQTGSIKTTYNELTNINQIPIRFEFLKDGLSVYAGIKAQAGEDVAPDMRCYSKTSAESPFSCTLNIDDEGGFYVSQLFNQGSRDVTVSVDPEIVFGQAVNYAGFFHYESRYGAETGGYLVNKPAECSSDDWVNLVTQTSLGFGTVENGAVAVQNTLAFAGSETPKHNIFLGGSLEMSADVSLLVRTYAQGQAANDIAAHLMGHPIVRVVFRRACEEPLQMDFSTDRVRLMNQILTVIGGKL